MIRELWRRGVGVSGEVRIVQYVLCCVVFCCVVKTRLGGRDYLDLAGVGYGES